MKKYLTTEEFGKLMGWTIKTIHCRVSNGSDMPKSMRIGNRRLWPADAVDAWIEAHIVETGVQI